MSNNRRKTRVSQLGFIYPAMIVCLILTFSARGFSQIQSYQGWVWQNPLPQGNPLHSVHFARDTQIGYAVGADSTLLRTDNGGFRWEEQAAPVTTSFSGVFVKDEKNAVVVGARGVILTTANGGKDWKPVQKEINEHL